MSSNLEAVSEENTGHPYAMQATKEAESEQSGQSSEAKPQSSAIYLGNKKFESVDELAKYTSQLEQERAVSAQPQAEAKQTGKKISELLFEDPDQALEIHEQRIIKKLKEEEAAKNNEVAFWNRFYVDHKDLSDERDVVDFVLGKNWNELRAMHPDQAAERLAEYSRKTLMRFKKTAGEKKELPSGQAKVGPANTQSAPKIEQKQAAPIDFVTQLKKIQSKRK